jgi:hypothetical protein
MSYVTRASSPDRRGEQARRHRGSPSGIAAPRRENNRAGAGHPDLEGSRRTNAAGHLAHQPRRPFGAGPAARDRCPHHQAKTNRAVLAPPRPWGRPARASPPGGCGWGNVVDRIRGFHGPTATSESAVPGANVRRDSSSGPFRLGHRTASRSRSRCGQLYADGSATIEPSRARWPAVERASPPRAWRVVGQRRVRWRGTAAAPHFSTASACDRQCFGSLLAAPPRRE